MLTFFFYYLLLVAEPQPANRGAGPPGRHYPQTDRRHPRSRPERQSVPGAGAQVPGERGRGGGKAGHCSARLRGRSRRLAAWAAEALCTAGARACGRALLCRGLRPAGREARSSQAVVHTCSALCPCRHDLLIRARLDPDVASTSPAHTCARAHTLTQPQPVVLSWHRGRNLWPHLKKGALEVF